MCRYSYRSGACANRHVDSLECIGEEKCQHSDLNVLTKAGASRDSRDCGHERWLGLYCEKYGRFYCPGTERCATPEQYMRHFEAHQESLLRRQEE